jgi:ABC-type nickel/cobalt efflux system permease component RcnA
MVGMYWDGGATIIPTMVAALCIMVVSIAKAFVFFKKVTQTVVHDDHSHQKRVSEIMVLLNMTVGPSAAYI